MYKTHIGVTEMYMTSYELCKLFDSHGIGHNFLKNLNSIIFCEPVYVYEFEFSCLRIMFSYVTYLACASRRQGLYLIYLFYFILFVLFSIIMG